MKLEFSRVFPKMHIKFRENLTSWSRVFPCGQTDGHEANSSFSRLCKRA